jgi:uncharacterized cupin superfamily protein
LPVQAGTEAQSRGGTRHEYLPGDSLVLPIGYKGTWEMLGNYRKLVVLAQKDAR